jgi:hypothetical protein
LGRVSWVESNNYVIKAVAACLRLIGYMQGAVFIEAAAANTITSFGATLAIDEYLDLLTKVR